MYRATSFCSQGPGLELVDDVLATGNELVERPPPATLVAGRETEGARVTYGILVVLNELDDVVDPRLVVSGVVAQFLNHAILDADHARALDSLSAEETGVMELARPMLAEE